ncbi:IS110 family transposase [Lentzea terrae]|uniref:IS110 family transposase n=1 Tax=Lentzea terrae TaxID=2200761 RepID=UPI001E52F2E1|nr:IS110 family transposase [Lentzea terrae]
MADIGRFIDKGRFASWNGTAPLEASSGDQRRHRLSRAGNRKINRVLHVMAIVQLRYDTPGRVYYRRPRVNGDAGTVSPRTRPPDKHQGIARSARPVAIRAAGWPLQRHSSRTWPPCRCESSDPSRSSRSDQMSLLIPLPTRPPLTPPITPPTAPLIMASRILPESPPPIAAPHRAVHPAEPRLADEFKPEVHRRTSSSCCTWCRPPGGGSGWSRLSPPR